MNLEEFINENMDLNEDNMYYNENFCNLVMNYLGSYECTHKDIEYLNHKGYEKDDFLKED